MYQDIINFLLGRKKKLLSKEEADHLIKLIAQSMGLQDEYKEKCDDKYVIKRILDNVVLEEDNNYDDTLCEDIGDIFDFDEYSYDDEYSECSDNIGSIGDDQPLSKRKIKRKNAFNFSKRKLIEEEEDDKVKISYIGDKDVVSLINKNEDAINRDSKDEDIVDDNKDQDVVGNDKDESNVESNNDKDISNVTKDHTNICNSTVSFKLPSNISTKFVFDPPKEKTEEFKFDIGDLDDVNDEGPTFEFFDEDDKLI